MLLQKRIVLDPGHGGKDFGAFYDSLKESELTLELGLNTERKLKILGDSNIYLTRRTGVFLTLTERVQIANQLKADIFISLHFNSFSQSFAKGIEAYADLDRVNKRIVDNSKDLAIDILNCVQSNLNLHKYEEPERGFKASHFQVIRYTQMPAVLFEGPFLSSPTDRLLLLQPNFIEVLGGGIANGIHQFFHKDIIS
uniref:MurNAc-LAA domain-containing protein n=1 Tax=Glaucocystis incrassata TaxID=1789788 RepID=A0A3G1IVD1_9EUKA|nr:hypothetical protein [Glaucocystis incrassata]ASQ40016.1 hypothetical protein [Glaucocystis incrassata]